MIEEFRFALPFQPFNFATGYTEGALLTIPSNIEKCRYKI